MLLRWNNASISAARLKLEQQDFCVCTSSTEPQTALKKQRKGLSVGFFFLARVQVVTSLLHALPLLVKWPNRKESGAVKQALMTSRVPAEKVGPLLCL